VSPRAAPSVRTHTAENNIIRGERSSIATSMIYGEFFPNPGVLPHTTNGWMPVHTWGSAFAVEAWGTGTCVRVCCAGSGVGSCYASLAVVCNERAEGGGADDLTFTSVWLQGFSCS
jgi:hypothetical protein